MFYKYIYYFRMSAAVHLFSKKWSKVVYNLFPASFSGLALPGASCPRMAGATALVDGLLPGLQLVSFGTPTNGSAADSSVRFKNFKSYLGNRK